MKKQVVYLSGPISNIPDGNYHLFGKLQERIESLGYQVLNPHELCERIARNLYPTHEEHWVACMRACVTALPLADIVVTLPEWEQSKGAVKEVNIARELGFIDVEFSLNFLRRHNVELN